ncbi:MAG: rod-binding protein [Alphaproteobacteria bacterium]|nr:rod-binding protein [Alphaproteobacteria bacterium]
MSTVNVQAVTSTPAPATQNGAAPPAKLKTAAQAFEAIFMRELLKSARDAKLGDDIFGSKATDNFQEMADAQYADIMAKQGQFGIAQMLVKQFQGKGG